MLLVSEPTIGPDEKAVLAEVIDSGWITMGDRVHAFEKEFAQRQGVAGAVAVSSGTAALHLILEAFGIGPGDEVLVPSLTFVATANCVLYSGASPVFVDIESVEWPLMDRSDAAAKCTNRTRALIVVHYAGAVADIAEWQEFARARNLLLIEDAAHATGVDLVGTMGDAAAFSFYGNKNMTTAEGGAVIAKRGDILAKIRQMRGHGMTTGTFQRYASRSVGYDVTMLGYNYRMDELRAAIGLVQLKKLTQWNDKRKALTECYLEYLPEMCPQITLPFGTLAGTSRMISSHHILPVLLPEFADRGNVICRLRDAGIQSSNHYPPVHKLSYYAARYPEVGLPKTETFARRELTLPLHPGMEFWQVRHVADALSQAVTACQNALGYEPVTSQARLE